MPASGGEVGRDPRCAVALDDPTVSARHARLEYRDGVWRVTDLGSTNGTFVNGSGSSSRPSGGGTSSSSDGPAGVSGPERSPGDGPEIFGISVLI
ncbi:MAG: FHA domain-containing protein [Anaerolineae bacterium]